MRLQMPPRHARQEGLDRTHHFRRDGGQSKVNSFLALSILNRDLIKKAVGPGTLAQGGGGQSFFRENFEQISHASAILSARAFEAFASTGLFPAAKLTDLYLKATMSTLEYSVSCSRHAHQRLSGEVGSDLISQNV